jgi:hypothetical protein
VNRLILLQLGRTMSRDLTSVVEEACVSVPIDDAA